jgi:hypothetical protein
MRLCAKHPKALKVYGYSKSWDLFLARDRAGKGWPANYTVNLSNGSRYYNDPAMFSAMEKLPCVRGEFAAVDVEWKDGIHQPQNKLDVDYIKKVIDYFAAKPTAKAQTIKSWRNKLNQLIDYNAGVPGAKKPAVIPEEWWAVNPAYEEQVREAAKRVYPSVFVCPGKCGTCPRGDARSTEPGRHACGKHRPLKENGTVMGKLGVAIVIAKH